MNRPPISDRDGCQTVINILVWILNYERKTTYVKLSKFHSKSEKDVTV